MNHSPLVSEWSAAYEQEHGHRPDDIVLQLAEHILVVGKMFVDLGHKDAQEGKNPYPAGAFPDIVRKAFRNIPEDASTAEIANLWLSYYMDGYNNR